MNHNVPMLLCSAELIIMHLSKSSLACIQYHLLMVPVSKTNNLLVL